MPDFVLFGPVHLLIMALVPGAAGLVALGCRGRPVVAQKLLRGVGILLAFNEMVWYVYRVTTEGFRFPEGLPLNLCDLTLWLTVAAALTRSRAVFEPAYYAGIGGSSMALLTPDLWAPLFSYPTVYFFLAHGGVVATLLALVWTGQCRPRPGSEWRVLAILNVFVAAVGAFNAWFGTNYIYLCRKPASASLLDYLGPWPWYIAAGEAVALAVFGLLGLPFRRGWRLRLTAAGWAKSR